MIVLGTSYIEQLVFGRQDPGPGVGTGSLSSDFRDEIVKFGPAIVLLTFQQLAGPGLREASLPNGLLLLACPNITDVLCLSRGLYEDGPGPINFPKRSREDLPKEKPWLEFDRVCIGRYEVGPGAIGLFRDIGRERIVYAGELSEIGL